MRLRRNPELAARAVALVAEIQWQLSPEYTRLQAAREQTLVALYRLEAQLWAPSHLIEEVRKGK